MIYSAWRSAAKALLIVSVMFAFRGSAVAGFTTPVIYQADVSPSSIVIGFLNADNFVDIAVANSGSNDISVFLGNGDGTFQPAVNYPVGVTPLAIATTCSTATGPANLAIANSGDNTLSVLIGNGDGTFQPAVNYSLGTGLSPHAVVGPDFNNDGYCDLAVANSAGGTNNNGNIAILLGKGDGTFQPAVNYDTLGVGPVAVTVNEFNGDFLTDLAVANFSSNSVTIFLGDGLGGFAASGDYSVGVGPTSLVSNFASVLPLVTTNSGTGNITRLDNTGNGTFNHTVNFAAGGMPVSITEGVLNKSGSLSLAVANQADNTISVFGEKAFKPYLRKPVTFPTCSSPKAVVAALLRPQRTEDLVVACSEGVGVMLNTLK